MDGEGDEYPENAFYMQGTFEDVIEEAKRVAAEATTSKWFMYGTLNNTKYTNYYYIQSSHLITLQSSNSQMHIFILMNIELTWYNTLMR